VVLLLLLVILLHLGLIVAALVAAMMSQQRADGCQCVVVLQDGQIEHCSVAALCFGMPLNIDQTPVDTRCSLCTDYVLCIFDNITLYRQMSSWL
jgi:hypothetical protein